ncbi:MAG: hypothetical protein K2G45_00160 [Lachnospiraceae bacterium]|nr:hypothetical protein [Lachnospiraceae bacterium]
MYLFYLTMKTFNGVIAIGILLYSIIISILCPILKKKQKYAVMRILCVLPAIGAFVHFAVYGTITYWAFKYLYIETLLPLINLLPGKSGKLTAAKSVVASVLTFTVCINFLINSISSPMVHNYTRYSYTESFRKMLNTMEQEYVLNAWKHIDYDALLKEYLPRVEEAEKNNDELAYATIINEVTYRFYDSHVYSHLSPELNEAARENLAGNDYGLSMIKLDDGSVIAIFVEPDSESYKLGIHDGTTILSWNGQDINEAIENIECIYQTIQFPVESNEDVFRPVFLAGKGGDSVEITFVNDDGDKQSINVQKIGNYDNRFTMAYVKLLHYDMEWRNFYSCMLDDKCGYLQIISECYDTVSDDISALRNGYYPKLTEYYASLIQDLKEQGMEYLVVDIRNNGGGYDSVAGALASLFTDEKTHMVSFGYEDKEGYHIAESQYIFPDGRYKDIPVVVLVNAQCVSAGDGMAKFLGDCPNVTLMGITASGGVNQNNGGYIYLTDNICVAYPVFLSLSSDSEPLIDTDHTRKNRIPLDVTIPMTKESALKIFSFEEEIDYELEYAMEYLEKEMIE